MKTVAIIQARMGSSRLPGKVLKDLGGLPVLEWVVRAAQQTPGVCNTVVATTNLPADDIIENWCTKKNIMLHRGSEDDVLSRFVETAKMVNAEIIMRLTADCPFLDPLVCGTVLELFKKTKADYTSNCSPTTWPDGLDCEVFSSQALSQADREAILKIEREHVTPFIHYNRSRFLVRTVTCPLPNLHKHRWTLDHPEDLTFLRAVVKKIGAQKPPSYLDVLNALKNEKHLSNLNSDIKRNEGLIKSLAKEDASANRTYRKSDSLLVRACKAIPLGAQTFSKSHNQLPKKSPKFLTYGDGGCVWDVDGNRYVDFIMGLLPVVLGYRDPDVDQAITDQITSGISFSLATEIELELAEKIIKIIPSAEMVRFGKNGTDATSAAIRLARAFTGRDRIIACGYHGWQDWYIGATTRSKGVPNSVQNLTTMVPFNDLNSVRNLLVSQPAEFAALIIEPASTELPTGDFFQELKKLLHDHGVLLIFDEIITGFRFSLGGAQELFNVIPDLTCLGKGMGNGMPISAITGRADVMTEMEEIFFSGTFGGEALSLAASLAVIKKMEREPVIDYLWENGEVLAKNVEEIIYQFKLEDVISLVGAAPWKILTYQNHKTASKELIRSVLIQEMLENGVLLTASHNLCYAHDHENFNTVLDAYNAALSKISDSLKKGTLEDILEGQPIKPLFKVRDT